jgi:hypothetical protein
MKFFVGFVLFTIIAAVMMWVFSEAHEIDNRR